MKYPLVTTSWLEAHLTDSDLIVLDASMDPVVGKEPIVYEQPVCLPGAQKFALEQAFCDRQSTQLHAMPTAAQFTAGAQQLGINIDSRVVIYDNQGIYSAPRAWWTFKLMGFDHVYVLDGGLPQWLAEGRKTTAHYRESVPQPGNVQGDYCRALVCDAQTVLHNIKRPESCIVDARSAQRFCAEVPEPRAGVRAGHIPGSLNLPFANLLESHGFKGTDKLNQMFANLVGEADKKLIFTCGSGITACILLLASVAAGYSQVVLYDGSWAEWGSNPDWPIE